MTVADDGRPGPAATAWCGRCPAWCAGACGGEGREAIADCGRLGAAAAAAVAAANVAPKPTPSPRPPRRAAAAEHVRAHRPPLLPVLPLENMGRWTVLLGGWLVAVLLGGW